MHFLGAENSPESPNLDQRMGSLAIRTDEIYFSISCLVQRSRVLYFLRLPSRRDVAAETEAAVQRAHIVFVFFFLLSTMIVPLIEVVVLVIEAPDHLL